MGFGISVLGDDQNPTGYGSKQPNIIGPVSLLHLLKYLLCCQRGKQQMKNDSSV